MSKNARKLQSASRPPVDALQYEKLALSTFHLCDQQLGQLSRLASLAGMICRCPTMTRDERRSQHALLELLVETVEGYERDLEHDRDFYQIIALDAKGVPNSRITASRAATLLAEAAKASAARLQAYAEVATTAAFEAPQHASEVNVGSFANVGEQAVSIQY